MRPQLWRTPPKLLQNGEILTKLGVCSGKRSFCRGGSGFLGVEVAKWGFCGKTDFYTRFLTIVKGRSLQRVEVPMLPNMFFHCSEGSLAAVHDCCLLGFWEISLQRVSFGCPQISKFFFWWGQLHWSEEVVRCSEQLLFFSSQGPLTIAKLVLAARSCFCLCHSLLDAVFVLD